MKKKILVSIIGIALVISVGFNIYQLSSLNNANTQNRELQSTIAELKTSISNYEEIIADNEKSISDLKKTMEELQSENESLSYTFNQDDIDPDVHTTYDDSTGKVAIDQTMIEALSTCNKAFDTSSYDATLADAEFYMVMYHLGDLEKEIWFEFCETGDLNLIFGEGEEDSHTAMRDEWNSIYNNDSESLTTPVTPDTNTPAQEPVSRPSTPTTQPSTPNTTTPSSNQSSDLTPEEQAALDAAFAGSGDTKLTELDPAAADFVIK